MTDPREKDSATPVQPAYTTTPPEDRVGAADEAKYVPVDVPDAKEVTGAFDHLATRDPVLMETAPQDAQFAGADAVVEGGGAATVAGDLFAGVAPALGKELNLTEADVAGRLPGAETDPDRTR